ncbi:MAG: EAL domain-containing protein, partial [Acidimicrobiales bacterium]|nr:EAL domain-containing protein [Acidimicrobiales bacterium]
LAIDDFGTGFSSMLYLKRLPLTSIKVDRAFVMGLPDDTRDRAIVGSTVELASALGVSITAEGVEDLRQRDALVAMGCTRAQGFLLSEPESDADFTRRLDLAATDPAA